MDPAQRAATIDVTKARARTARVLRRIFAIEASSLKEVCEVEARVEDEADRSSGAEDWSEFDGVAILANRETARLPNEFDF